MTLGTSKNQVDNLPKEIYPTVVLWSLQDFIKTRKQETKNDAISSAIGIAVALLGAWLINITKEGSQFLLVILAIFTFIGLWLGIIRWLVRFMSTPNFNARRRITEKYEVWHRVVNCPSCGQDSTISIGYIEYHCLECGVKNSIAYGTDSLNVSLGLADTTDRPVKFMEKGLICWSCNKPNYPLQRPAQFECPKCQKPVNLKSIPV